MADGLMSTVPAAPDSLRSVGTLLLLVRTLLGLDFADGRASADPRVPPQLAGLTARSVPASGLNWAVSA